MVKYIIRKYIIDFNENVKSKISANRMHVETRGPKGPWVAHLRKRSKVTVEPFTEDHSCCPTNIGRGPLNDVIHQI